MLAVWSSDENIYRDQPNSSLSQMITELDSVLDRYSLTGSRQTRLCLDLLLILVYNRIQIGTVIVSYTNNTVCFNLQQLTTLLTKP